MTSTRRWYLAAPALIAVAALALVPACGQDDGEQAVSPSTAASTPAASPSVVPSPTAAPSVTPAAPTVSWQWVRTKEYRDWERAPGWSARRETGSPHSVAKEIFVDPAIAATVGSGATRYPEGATIVKDGYDEGGDLAIVAVMQRLAGDGWSFAEYRADGSVVVEGEDPPLCTRCHKGDQDGVLAFSLE
jgi:hypothetical protein